MDISSLAPNADIRVHSSLRGSGPQSTELPRVHTYTQGLNNLSPPRPLTPPMLQSDRSAAPASAVYQLLLVLRKLISLQVIDRSIHNGCVFSLFFCPAQTHGLDFSRPRCDPGLPGSCGACIGQAPRGEEAD